MTTDDRTPQTEAANAQETANNAGEERRGNPAAAEGGSLEQQLQQARAERDANYEKWLRAEADLENYRRRVQREAEQERLYRALPLVRDLLPVIDNLQRAVHHAQSETQQASGQLLRGVQMVAQQIEDIFRRHDVEPIQAEGKPFDPNLHEAVQQVPSAEHPPMTVLQVVERGYTLHDRVVRPARVVVSSTPPEQQ